MAQQPFRRPPRLRITKLGVIPDGGDFIRGLEAHGHEILWGLHTVSQADMVLFDTPHIVDQLAPLVRPGQIVILVDFCSSLAVLEPLAARGCHTIVLMPLAPHRYAFLADQEIAAVVMELLITELASLCEHVPAERHQKFVAGFVLSQLAGEVYQLGALLQDPNGNSISGMLGPDGPDFGDNSGPVDLADPADSTKPVKQDLPSWLTTKSLESKLQDSQGPAATPPKQPAQPAHPALDPLDPQPLLPKQLLRQHALAWCADALPTDHARSVFYTLLYYGLSQHNTTPHDLVAWAENQQQEHQGDL